MATPQNLMGAGLPAEVANQLGNVPATLAGIGTSQTTAATIRTSMTDLTATSGQTAFVMSSTGAITRLYFLSNSSVGATTALIFPASGGSINNGTTDASVSLAQNKTAIMWRYSQTKWFFLLTA